MNGYEKWNRACFKKKKRKNWGWQKLQNMKLKDRNWKWKEINSEVRDNNIPSTNKSSAESVRKHRENRKYLQF